MAPYGGVYITHMRSEADHLLEAIDEAIEIGRDGGVPVEIYHLKAAGRRNWPKAEAAIARIAAARAQGQDVGADMYPYIAGCTGLTACSPLGLGRRQALRTSPIPPSGPRSAPRSSTRRPTGRTWGSWPPRRTSWSSASRSRRTRSTPASGSPRSPAEGKHWLDAAMDLILAEHKSIDTVYFMMSEENVKLQLRQPWIKFGTDAGGSTPSIRESLVHPRAYGTFPRILGKYVREEKVISAGGGDPEDDLGRRRAALDPRPRAAPRGVRRRRRDLRPRDDRRPGHLRVAAPVLGRRPARLRQRHGRRPRRAAHRGQAGPDRPRAGVSGSPTE